MVDNFIIICAFIHIYPIVIYLTEFMSLKLFALILLPTKYFVSSRCKMTGKFSVFVYVTEFFQYCIYFHGSFTVYK